MGCRVWEGGLGGIEPLGNAEMEWSQDSQVWEGHRAYREDRSYYPHFKVKKTDILGDVKNFHMVTQLMSGISKCQTTCLSLGPKAELQQELQCRHSSGSVIAGQ